MWLRLREYPKTNSTETGDLMSEEKIKCLGFAFVVSRMGAGGRGIK